MLVKYIMNVFKNLFKGKKLNCNEVVKETSSGKYKQLDTFLDEILNYTADEVVIGTFLGKPLYRRVVSGTGVSNVDGSTTGIDKIKKLTGYIKSSYGQWWPFNNYFSDGGYITSSFVDDQNQLRLTTGANFNSSSKWYYTLEYTKLSD